ncbi:MAG: CDP-glycerol glycerophosphotransferase family protein [Acidobacteria bacterium]|nr:CDP-glycerol glycerophosphotransferase family protein [Acidobacteriota bacterium]
MRVIRDLVERAHRTCVKWPALQAWARTLYACLRLIVPTSPKLIAFCSHPDCADNAYALFEQVMKSPRAEEFRLVWLATDPEAAEKTLRQDYPELDSRLVRVVRKNTLRGLFWFLRSRWVFYTHGAYWFARSGVHQTVVNLWHGMPIKKLGTFDQIGLKELPFSHYSLATSDFFADLVAAAFPMSRDHVLVTGLPRNEWLFQHDPRYASLRDGRSRLIVWLPTFRQAVFGRHARTDTTANTSEPIAAENLVDLDRKLDDTDTLLVIKFHAADARRLRTWPSYRNIRIYTDQAFREDNLNVYKLLACSDALVTDYSSIAIDYLLLRKPIGFFTPDIAAYIRGFMPGVWERLSVCPQLKTVEELAAFIKNPALCRPMTTEIEDLHQQDLREPSRAILSAVGLGALLPARESTRAALVEHSARDRSVVPRKRAGSEQVTTEGVG